MGQVINAKDFAKKLNGRKVGHEITEDEEALAEANGLVIIFGASDDLAEIRGAIRDEVGCYNGGVIPFYKGDVLTKQCDNDDCPHEEAMIEKAKCVKALWCEKNDGWSYEAPFSVERFSIEEDGEEYCEGIIFHKRNIN